ncbi:O-antigen ligase family protein [Azospirillum sp. B4]|uniref:O-antigen ligase family protein n=1 Tax=Azospirillum sp. B4 TaxID=95605 RepID=UPI00034DCA9C|nr:O-antigen ligase family protein [Azospirillum sp. B4]
MPQGPSRSLTLSSQGTEWLSLALIGMLLTGYALFSKGFAYLGFPPVFIGEIVMALCLALFAMRPDFTLLRMPGAPWLIIAFGLFCVFQTIPYVGTYGLMALRDAVIYGYAVFAILLGTLMKRQSRMQALLPVFDIVSLVVVLATPLVVYLARHQGVQVAGSPPLLFQKAGDLAVQLAGAACFRLTGLSGWRPKGPTSLKRVLDIGFWVAWILCTAWAAASSRGAMLAIFIAVAVVFTAGFNRRTILFGAGFLVATTILTTAFNVAVEQGGDARTVSGEQLFANAMSVVGYEIGDDSTNGTLRGTVKWRTIWWDRIVVAAMKEENFFSGRGFGINLAVADGISADATEILRSPHSIHLNILARAGFIGLGLWIALLLSFAYSLWAAIRRMRRRGLVAWSAMGTWILAYWLAAIVNASFDVYIEGPQGGIWTWCLMGLGLAFIWLERQGSARLMGQQIPLAAH